MKKWTRRSLVLGTAAVAVPVLAYGAGKLWCQANIVQGALLRSLSPLMAMYTDSDLAAALGERYLRQTGLSAFSAFERLQANERLRHAAATGCPVKTISVAEQACREDFHFNRIHCIDGWVLAETELDVAALFTVPGLASLQASYTSLRRR
jgi:hypothetical protein